MEEPRWSGPDTAVLVIGLVLLLAFTFPVYALANRVNPIVLGLPFGMFWIVAWVAVGAIALVAVYRRDSRGDR